MATNLELQKSLNDLLEEAATLLEAQTKQYQSQATIIAGMVRAQAVLNEAAGGDKFEQVAEALDKAAEAAEKYSSKEQQLKKIKEALDENESSSEKLNKSLENLVSTMAEMSIAEQMLHGVANGFSFVANAAKGLISFGGSVVRTLGHLAASIIAFPFRLLQNLINASDQGGSNELAQQLEEIRREFGYLNKTAGGAIVSLGKGMQGQLANTGLSVYRVFGNLAQRLKFVFEYAKNLGPVFDALNFSLGQGGAEALGAYNKALGLTAEGQKAIATRALASGRTVNDVNREVANYAIQLSQQFGVTMTAVGRDIGTMMSDFEHFGHLAPQQLAQTAVFARRLGVEVKALAGIMEKSFNFEDAANQAAQLSQAFGLNIDALQQMREQDPGRQLDNLRRAFFAAGRSIEGMTRQERRLLQTQTGLDAASLDAAFSLKSQALSYDQIQKKGDAAKNSQLTQAQAMQKLAGAIERLVQSGGSGSGGFFDRFFKGFDTGIKRTREYRELMINLQRALRATYMAGIQVGQAFVHAFPGIRDVFKGISGFFEPRRFRTMLNGVVTALRQFFTDLTTNPRQALPRLLDRLKTGFFDYFQSNSQSGQRLLRGVRAFFLAFTTIANSMLKVGITGVTKGIQYIVDLLTGRKHVPTPGAAGTGGAFAEAFSRLVDGLGPVFRDLWKSIQQLFGVLWSKARPWVMRSIVPALVALFGPSVVMSIARGIGTALISALGTALLKGIQSRVLGRTLERAGPSLGRQAQQTLERAPRAGAGAGADQSEAINGAARSGQAVERSGRQQWGQLARTLVMIAAFIVIGIGAMVLTVLAIRRWNIQPREIIEAGMMMVAMVPLIVSAAAVTVVAGRLPRGDAGSIALGLLFIGGTALAMGAVAIGIVGMVKSFHFSRADIANAGIMMAAISGMFIAATVVVVAGALIGAAVTATGGIGAVVIIAAVAFLALVVEGMVAQGMRIITQINRFHPEPGFEGKVAVFLDVIRTIGAFAGSLGTIVSAASPGILGVVSSAIFGNDPQREMQKTLGGIVNIITAMGDQITRIIAQIMTFASRMTPEQVDRGRIIGETLGAVGSLAQALAGPTELFKNTSGSIFGIQFGSDVTDKLRQFATNIGLMGATLINVMRAVTQMMTAVGPAGATVEQVRAGQMIGSVLSAIGELAQNLMPRRATLEALNGARDFSGALTNINTFIRSMLDTIIGSSLLTHIRVFVSTFLRDIGGMTAQQSQRAAQVAPVIAEALKAMVAVSTLVANVLPTNVAVTPLNQTAIDALLGFTTSFINQITSAVPRIMTTMLSLANQISPTQLRAMKGIAEGISGFLHVVAEIPTLVAGFAGELPHGSAINVVSVAEAVTRTMVTTQLLHRVLENVFDADFIRTIQLVSSVSIPRDMTAKMAALKGMFDAIGAIPTAMQAFNNLPTNSNNAGIGARVDGVIGGVSQLVAALTNPTTSSGLINPFLTSAGANYLGARFSAFAIPRGINEKITQAAAFVENLATAGTSMTSVVRTTAIASIASGVAQMVRDVNAISTELANLHPVDISANLGRLAHNMGLGQAQEFTVARGRINMTIQNTTTINAGDLEYVLVNRVGSTIATIRRPGT